jgi:hypothetical protein
LSPAALVAATIALFVGLAITLAASPLPSSSPAALVAAAITLFGAVAIARPQPFSSSPLLLPPLHSLSPTTLVAVAIARLIVVLL